MRVVGDDSEHDPLDDSERDDPEEVVDDLADDSHDDRDEPQVWFEGWAQLKRAVALHLARLKAAMAAWPLSWFFAIALLPPLALVLLRSEPLISDASRCFLLVAMLLVVWALDDREKASSRTARRVALFAATFAVCAAAFPLAEWAQLRRWPLGNAGYARHVWWYLTTWQEYPCLVATAFAVSCLLSPTSTLRRLVRDILDWSAPRSSYVFALAAWPILAVVFVIGTYVFSGSPQMSPWRVALSGYTLLTLPMIFITSALGTLAWFGVAARRLLTRHDLLATVFMIAAAQNVVVIAVSVRYSSPLLDHVSFYMALAAGVATPAVAVRLLLGGGGSLGPLIAFTVVGAFTGERLTDLVVGWYDSEGLMIALFALICLMGITVAWRGDRLLPPRPPTREQPEVRSEGEPDSASAG
jgi:hypothetical protein